MREKWFGQIIDENLRHIQNLMEQPRKNKHIPLTLLDNKRKDYVSIISAPEEFVQKITVTSFIDGVNNMELQQALRLDRHRKMNEAIVHALEFEAAKRACEKLQNIHNMWGYQQALRLSRHKELNEALIHAEYKQVLNNCGACSVCGSDRAER